MKAVYVQCSCLTEECLYQQLHIHERTLATLGLLHFGFWLLTCTCVMINTLGADRTRDFIFASTSQMSWMIHSSYILSCTYLNLLKISFATAETSHNGTNCAHIYSWDTSSTFHLIESSQGTTNINWTRWYPARCCGTYVKTKWYRSEHVLYIRSICWQRYSNELLFIKSTWVNNFVILYQLLGRLWVC
jgi:hypothetical protein